MQDMKATWFAHVHLTGPVYGQHSGIIGGVEFVDGKSVYPVGPGQIERIAANQRIVRYDEESGEELQVGAAAELVRANARHRKAIEEGKKNASTAQHESSANSNPEAEADGQGQLGREQDEPNEQRDSGNTESSVSGAEAERHTSLQVKDSELTRENLAPLADKYGLDGLRDLGNVRGVKDRSITSMIDKLVEYRELKETNV